MLFRDTSGLFSYTTGVNGVCQTHGLYWFREFIAAQQRVRRDPRFRKVQRWVHKVQFRRATVYLYAGDSDDNPLIFPQKLYCDVAEPEITFYLEGDVLSTKEERDAR